MNILVVGSPNSQAEFKSKFKSKHSVCFKSCGEVNLEEVKVAEIIFDFEITDDPQHGKLYHHNPQALLLLNSVKTTLVELEKNHHWSNQILGFNGFPGMFNRPLLELTTLSVDRTTVQEICRQLDSEYRIVEDTVGMVTPRVICMIINEAYYTLDEGTAKEADIELAMKLGTNYPAGPFEMAMNIGYSHVCGLLEAMQRNTNENKYSVCPLLKKRSLTE